MKIKLPLNYQQYQIGVRYYLWETLRHRDLIREFKASLQAQKQASSQR